LIEQTDHKPEGCTARESEETPLDGQVCVTDEMIEAGAIVLQDYWPGEEKRRRFR